jgi:hypothetical protein
MKKTLVEVYALAVCFVTLVCFVVTLGIGIYDLIQFLNPEFTISSYTYEHHKISHLYLQISAIKPVQSNKSFSAGFAVQKL